MKKIIALVLALGMLLCLGACGSEETQQPANDNQTQSSANDVASKEEQTPKFKVTVVDQNGAPVVGAEVQICKDENCLMPLPTDENGMVEFNFEFSEGHKILLAHCPDGYETEYTDGNDLNIDDGETEFTFEITKK